VCMDGAGDIHTKYSARVIRRVDIFHWFKR